MLRDNLSVDIITVGVALVVLHATAGKAQPTRVLVDWAFHVADVFVECVVERFDERAP
jgi:hypothetical protein